MAPKSFMMYLTTFITLIVLASMPSQAGTIGAIQEDYTLKQMNSTNITKFEEIDSNNLLRIVGLVGCKSKEDRKAVNQAFADAIEIAAAVAPTVGDVDKIDPKLWHNKVWWGEYDPKPWMAITASLRRMRGIKDQWWLGDIFNARYYEVRCHNANDLLNAEGHGCGRGSDGGNPHAHTVSKKQVGNTYDTIVLCDNWFEDLIPFREKVTRMDDPNTVYRRDNLLSLKTQGSTFLHEMLHTGFDQIEDRAGLTRPPAGDVKIRRKGFKRKAYDAAKAKYLAKATVGGMLMARKNVDNYVYYALWCFVKARWDVDATQPPAAWKNPPPGQADGYTIYRNGDTSLPDAEYEAELDPGRMDESDASYFSGQVCNTDADCEGTCPPDYRFFCSSKDAGNACTCLLGFRPPS